MYTKERRIISIHQILKSLVCLYTLIIIYQNVFCCEFSIEEDTKITKVVCYYSYNITHELLDIRNELLNVNEQLNFDRIELHSPIKELPSNVFLDISFKYIFIYDSYGLRRIHKNAFNGNSFTQYFISYRNFKLQLKNEPPDYDLYEAFRSLVQLKQLLLSLATNQSHEIPDNTFRPNPGAGHQKYLEVVEWYGYFTITRIGNDVIYELPNIKEIVFKHAIVKQISAKAFRLKINELSTSLNISFLNTTLTEHSFEHGVFSNIHRNVRLDLSDNLITIIDENIFRPFFSANQNNYLILAQNPLNCSNIDSFKWLFIDKNKLNLENRIKKAVCGNGTKLWDLIYDWNDSETITTVTEIGTSDKETTNTEPTEDIHFETTVTEGTVLSTTGDQTISLEPEIMSSTFSVTKPGISSTTLVTNTTCDSICLTTKPGFTSSSTFTNSVSYSSTNLITKPIIVSTISSSITTGSYSSTGSEEQNNDQIISNINEKVDELINTTKIDGYLNSTEELKDVLDKIREIHSSLDSMNDLNFESALNVTTNILNVLSNLLNQNDAWLNSSGSERTSIASQLLQQVQFTSLFLTCNQNDSNKTINRLTNDNIIADVYRNFDQKIHFTANYSSILIPEEVVHWNGVSVCGNSSFAALITRLDEYLNESLRNDQNINTQIISYSQTNTSDIIELNGTWIKFSLKHKSRLEFGDQMLCVFWDFSSMEWSTKGCQLLTTESDRDVTVCECNHLTNFAAIMDITNRETDDSLKSLLTNIFCGISLFCFVLTVFLLLRPQPNKSNTITNRLIRTRNIITMNLAIMLSITDILIIFGMDRKYNDRLCMAMSGILLYSLLSSFSWMLLEGYHLYKMTVRVFNSNGRKLLLFLFGYGVPVVVIFFGFLIIWIRDSILFDALIGDYFCWIASAKYPGHIWLLIGPALIALAFNLIMLLILVIKVCKSSTNQNKSKFGQRIKRIFGVTSLLFNLGITWLSFILYIKQFGSYFSYFSYVFIVLNGSQGIFIFIYHLVIYLSKNKNFKNWYIRTGLRLTLSNKWSIRTNQTQLGDN